MIQNLLLQLLIVLLPAFGHSFLKGDDDKEPSDWIVGISYGAVAFACMVMPYSVSGMHWDLRFVPLVLAFTYGGLIGGGLACMSIVIASLAVGGDWMWFWIIACLAAAAVPAYFIRSIRAARGPVRVRAALWLSAGLGTVLILVMLAYFRYDGSLEQFDGMLLNLAVFGGIHMLGVGICTKLHETIRERNAMRHEIERAQKLQTLGELAASIAHEVRNPLTVVRGFVQLFGRDPSFVNPQHLTLVMEELDRAETIIGDYLNYSKPRPRSMERFDLARLIERVATLLQPLCANRDVDLRIEVDEAIWMEADKFKVQQAIVNIVKNAVEATPKGGNVEVRLKTDRQKAVIVVSDTGKGMSVEELGRVGTYFYSAKEAGTGLGTAVTKQIIRTMDGTILYRSEPGKGTEVTVVLPVIESNQESTLATG